MKWMIVDFSQDSKDIISDGFSIVSCGSSATNVSSNSVEFTILKQDHSELLNSVDFFYFGLFGFSQNISIGEFDWQ